MRVRLFKAASLLNIAGRDDDVAQQLWLNIGREILRNQEHILQFGLTMPRLASASFLLEMARRMPGRRRGSFVDTKAGYCRLSGYQDRNRILNVYGSCEVWRYRSVLPPDHSSEPNAPDPTPG